MTSPTRHPTPEDPESLPLLVPKQPPPRVEPPSSPSGRQARSFGKGSASGHHARSDKGSSSGKGLPFRRRSSPANGSSSNGSSSNRSSSNGSSSNGSSSNGSPKDSSSSSTLLNDSSAMAEERQISMWQRYRELFTGMRARVAVIAVSSIVAGLCETLLLIIVAEVATSLVGKHATQATPSDETSLLHLHLTLDKLLLVSVGVALLRIAMSGIQSHVPARMIADVQAGMRRRLFAAYARSSWPAQASDGEGKFQETITQQLLQATQAILNANGVIVNGIMLMVLVAGALYVNLYAALAVLVAAVVISAALRPFNRVGRRQARLLSQAQIGYAAGIHDAVNLTEETHVFGVAEAQERELDVLVATAQWRYYLTQLLNRVVPNSYQGAVFLLLIGGLALAASSSHGAHTALLGGVVLLMVRASSYGQNVQGSWLSLHQTLPFIDRVEGAVDRYRSSPEVRGSRRLERATELTFDGVCYEYVPGVPVLKSVSFSIATGESIGIVGPSGAGKSTLVQIFLGLRQPKTGRYLVTERSAEQWSRETWTSCFAYVPQEPRLLHATVAENIAFYRDIPQGEIERAARQAQIHDDIMTWRQGYETVISQRANAVSGGQRQRLCLARALAGQPSVIVLDEPTSSLDPRSESLVQESLMALKGQVTLIIIAHRFSTLNVCDRVMVMRDGRLEAFAPAHELMGSNDYYRNAAELSLTSNAG